MMRWFRAFLPKEERFFDLFDRHAQTVIQGSIFVVCVLTFRRGVIGEIAHYFRRSL